MQLLNKNFSYLIAQPNIDFFTEKDFSKNGVVPIQYRVLKYLANNPPIPIPLKGEGTIASNINAFLGFQEKSSMSSSTIVTKTVKEILSKYSQSTEGFNGKIAFANSNVMATEKGDTTFNLSITSTTENIFNVAFIVFMETASKTLFNTVFHYISNNALLFNLVMTNFTNNSTENNSSFNLSFTYYERAIAQSVTNQKSTSESLGF